MLAANGARFARSVRPTRAAWRAVGRNIAPSSGRVLAVTPLRAGLSSLLSQHARQFSSSCVNSPVSDPFVTRRTHGPVATLTLNRGRRFNPLSLEMIAALQHELDVVAADRSVHIVVVAGQGRGFCAGHDLKQMRHDSEDTPAQRRLFEACGRLMATITDLPQPVIARVHGIATAAGCQLVAACDLAIAAEDAKFALPGVNVGVFCSTPAVAVARNIGRKRTMEMLLSGKPIDASTAKDWGLVNRVVPAESLEAECEAWANELASSSATVVALGKRAFYYQIEQGVRDAYTHTSEVMACNVGLPAAREGMDAFLGKREPSWPQ